MWLSARRGSSTHSLLGAHVCGDQLGQGREQLLLVHAPACSDQTFYELDVLRRHRLPRQPDSLEGFALLAALGDRAVAQRKYVDLMLLKRCSAVLPATNDTSGH